MNFTSVFTRDGILQIWDCLISEVPLAIWNTLYATILATFFAILIGTPLGVLLVTGEQKGIRPLPRPVMKILNIVINLLRSVPFIILMVLVMPLSRLIAGNPIGTLASVIPLTVAAFPFIARLVESSLREVNPNIIEAAQSMGASTWQIVTRVMLPESVPSLITNFTLAITTIMGYTAMSGALGAEGLGKLALDYGYRRYTPSIMILAVVVLVILTQVMQTLGTFLARKSDRRLKNN